MTAAGAEHGQTDQALPVAPVLVRDYRRLVRLFPFAYRRDHGTEVLGHLLDGAAPGQSRPTPAERTDLLRAAAREWLLAPLGSTARQRRAATGLLTVLLPAVLGIHAARALAHAAWTLGGDGAPLLLQVAPLAPTWAVWCVGVVAVLAGLARTGRALVAAAAVAGLVTLVVLVGSGREHTAYLEAGWVLGLVAHAVVVAEHDRRLAPGRRWGRAAGTAGAVVGALGAYVMVIAPDNAWNGAPWWVAPYGSAWTLGGFVAPVVAVLAGAALWSRTRQAVPVLLGGVVGVGLGRSGLFWSGNVNAEAVDAGNVLALVGCALLAVVAARWVVNRLDELAEVRAAHRALLGTPT
ncbi:hypothetical protein H9623_05570 [Oerskovia sp. Sa1BUA8]|uniref:Uncharacterized protein n=1 Tax=Oerskovia douganii TaxID=2762210 RepID=A0A9D5U8K2_9CELL|nr:hypothetical protein [Oerskovia douganii]MBE7699779.1 hypothetical protein [Oerskovia douganii]